MDNIFTYVNKEDIPNLPTRKKACTKCPFNNNFHGQKEFQKELSDNKDVIKYHSCHTSEVNEGLLVTAKHQCKGFQLWKEKKL